MKKLLAKLSWLFTAACALVLAVCFTACATPKGADGEVVIEGNTYVITVTVAEEGSTLKDVMEQMQEDGKIAYTDVGGMITEMGGYAPDSDAHEFFALYTSLEGVTSAAYGTMEVGGVTYESAILGYGSLPAVVGEVYIWAIATW